MTRWQCPGCGEQIAAKAVAVGHRCKARHNKITDWVEVEVTDDDRPPHGTGSQVGTAPIGGGRQAFDQGLCPDPPSALSPPKKGLGQKTAEKIQHHTLIRPQSDEGRAAFSRRRYGGKLP
jgi:hypothetical protein